ncbi:amino acid ABC transporter permease [Gibbsiella quercinecans]|uniref:amino acid ABC transporter permease n=1 Tax=Gibbsiella quercinecans TaxID=929813 RepID=UPI003A4DACB1
MQYQFDLSALGSFLPHLPSAIANTLTLTFAVCVGITIFGVMGALARTHSSQLVRALMASYVEIMRNVPLLVILYLVYFTLAQVGLRIGGYWSAFIALTLNGTAFTTEIFRAGFATVPRGQYEAANALGLSRWQSFSMVIAPQAIRTVYAPLGNQYVATVLGTSLASVISVGELTDWMGTAGSYSSRYLEAFVVIGALYLLICQVVNVMRIVIGRVFIRKIPGRSGQ